MTEPAGTRRGHPRLSSPPLAEAIFELRAKSKRPYTLLAGQFAAGLASRYPSVTELEAAKIAAFAQLPAEAGLLVTHRLEESDKQRTVQLGAAGFAVNFTNYGGYDDFRSEVSRVTQLYFELADVLAVQRLGLRYVNFVKPGKDAFSALAVRIDWPDMPGAKIETLAARQIFQYDDPAGQLAIVIGTPDPRGSLLDFDFSSSPDRPMQIQEILSWADKAHERAYEAFRAMVRPEVFAAWEHSSFSEVG